MPEHPLAYPSWALLLDGSLAIYHHTVQSTDTLTIEVGRVPAKALPALLTELAHHLGYGLVRPPNPASVPLRSGATRRQEETGGALPTCPENAPSVTIEGHGSTNTTVRIPQLPELPTEAPRDLQRDTGESTDLRTRWQGHPLPPHPGPPGYRWLDGRGTSAALPREEG